MLHSLHTFVELIWSLGYGCLEDWILCGDIIQTFFCLFWSDRFPRWRHIRKSSSVVFAQLFGMSPHHESPEFTFFRSIRGGEDIPVGEISLVLCVVVILITVTFFAKSPPFAKAATEAVVTLDVDRAVRWIEFSCIFIGPESDHWLCLLLTNSLTDWLTDSLLFSKLESDHCLPLSLTHLTDWLPFLKWHEMSRSCWLKFWS